MSNLNHKIHLSLLRCYNILFRSENGYRFPSSKFNINLDDGILITNTYENVCYICHHYHNDYHDDYYKYHNNVYCSPCINVIKNIQQNTHDTITGDGIYCDIYYLCHNDNIILLSINNEIFKYSIDISCNAKIINELLTKQKITSILALHNIQYSNRYKIMYYINKDVSTNEYDNILSQYIAELIEIVFLLKSIMLHEHIKDIIITIINCKSCFK